MLTGLQWHGHASVRFQAGGNAVFVDPYQITSDAPVNVILITHSHFDHLSPEDVIKVRAAGCITVAPADCAQQLGPDTRVVAPGDRIDLGNGVIVEAHPAYNADKQFHPKESGWVGYVIEMDGRRVYVAGDTDHIPEMKEIRCDVAFMPVGGTYTMTAEQAASAVRDIDPKLAVPIHWGTIVGSREDAERFVRLCGDRGRLLEPIEG
jgi:L-ascorbate metabolism protein UlaG (beta-lactamase superfamily)